MTFPITSINPTAVFKSLEPIGAYSFEARQRYSKTLASILFGPEQLGVNATAASRSVAFKNPMLIQPTTSKDGRIVEWSTIAGKDVASTVSPGATSATQTVVSSQGMSPGDHLVFINPATGVEVDAYIESITSATVIVLTASITTTTNDIVKRISFSKEKSAPIDRNDYSLGKNTTNNYFQDFGSKFFVTKDELNSHMDFLFRGGFPDPKLAMMNDNQKMLYGVSNFLRMKSAQHLGMNMIGDIARSFVRGKRVIDTSSASNPRYYAGGLEEVVTTHTVSASAQDDEILDFLYDNIYDVSSLGQQYGNSRVVILANHSFKKKFGTLKSEDTRITLQAAPEEWGYNLQKIVFPGFEDVAFAYEPTLDQIGLDTTPTAYVIPMDLIGAYRNMFKDLSIDMQAENGIPDILIQKAVSDQDNLDTTTLFFYYYMTFVFGGRDAVTNFGANQSLYRKIKLT